MRRLDTTSLTPLHWALWRLHSDIVDIIVQQRNIDYNVRVRSVLGQENLAQLAAQLGRWWRCWR